MTVPIALLIAAVVGQTAVVLLLLRFVRSFGVYTHTLVQVHNTFLQVQDRQERITQMLADIETRRELTDTEEAA